MEAKLVSQHIIVSSIIRGGQKVRRKKESSPVIVGVLLARPADTISKSTDPGIAYKDTWFDLIAINYLSQTLQSTTGIRNNKSGYDSLVEAATAAAQSFNPKEQQEVVVGALERAFPQPILSMIRTLTPQSKFTRECFAIFTTFFFAWLIGHSQVKKSEDGKAERNVVHIKKCRFLEETKCAGMCINLCKMPSQRFIKDSLGMPINMVPNFEDMSCEMIFGEDPPAPADDPALKQPCYKMLCKAKQKHSMDCSN
ncbi:beta-carotene isomerase D27, chloroplastic [Macadamia integrifolia]|uniref:beta-carotene isomerase D27, chloroplastic n=1 Tax=Macadamia integrifolia TaxID=60698 RepID=UPI001C4EFEF4|nr:beta-carotene isomerase D27, chloroplastic [Macadamia integrifolia]